MDRLKAMTVVIAVVDTGSLSAAGRRLSMPLATVSRIISDLEAQLKVRLLNRSTRRVTLTEAGTAYAAAARRILEQVSEAERAAVGEFRTPRGDLVITAPIEFGRLHVLPVVTHFLERYPDIDVRLVLTDRVLHLIDEHLDLAFRVGALPDSSLIATRLGSLRHVVCASPAYLKARGVPKTPTDLASHDCISFGVMEAPRSWVFSKGTVAVRPRLIVNSAAAATDAVLSGLGIARLLSYQIERALDSKRLRIVLSRFEPDAIPVHMLHAGQGPLPLKLRVFLDFAAPRLRARLTRLSEIAR